MAEYIGIPVSKKDTNQTPESFQAVCNLWIKSEHWTLDDAVRLLTGVAPSAFETKKEEPSKSFKVILSIAKNCINKSLYTFKSSEFHEVRVDPLHFISWAKKKELPVPPELEISINYAKYNAEKLTKQNQEFTVTSNHKEKCRCMASYLWSIYPSLSIDEMIARTEIFEFGCEKIRYPNELIKNWIIDLTLVKK